MQTMLDPNDVDVSREEVRAQGEASDATAAERANWLHTNPSGGEIARLTHAPSAWPFPESDELFRSIYTRAGTGFASEVLAVCSAVAGEGKTTVGLGLAITIAQDFPERRVLL